MKSFIISAAVLLNIFGASAQRISIANERMNIFYLGCENPISIVVEDSNMEHLTIETENGTLTNKEGEYNFKPETVGTSEIIIYKTEQNKLVEIGRKSFLSKNLSPPTFMIGPGGSGSLISKSVLANQEYVRAEFYNICGCGNAEVKKFNLSVYNNRKCEIKEFENIGFRLSDKIIEAFSKLDAGDILIFEKIEVRMSDSYEFTLDPVLVRVK